MKRALQEAASLYLDAVAGCIIIIAKAVKPKRPPRKTRKPAWYDEVNK